MSKIGILYTVKPSNPRVEAPFGRVLDTSSKEFHQKPYNTTYREMSGISINEYIDPLPYVQHHLPPDPLPYVQHHLPPDPIAARDMMMVWVMLSATTRPYSQPEYLLLFCEGHLLLLLFSFFRHSGGQGAAAPLRPPALIYIYFPVFAYSINLNNIVL
jgi:hypothetical protein